MTNLRPAIPRPHAHPHSRSHLARSPGVCLWLKTFESQLAPVQPHSLSSHLDDSLPSASSSPPFFPTPTKRRKRTVIRSFFPDIHFDLPGSAVLSTGTRLISIAHDVFRKGQHYITESHVCYSEPSSIVSSTEAPPSSVPSPASHPLLRSSPVSSIFRATPARGAHRLSRAYPAVDHVHPCTTRRSFHLYSIRL